MIFVFSCNNNDDDDDDDDDSNRNKEYCKAQAQLVDQRKAISQVTRHVWYTRQCFGLTLGVTSALQILFYIT